MNIRATVYDRMVELQLSPAELARQLSGKVKQRRLYGFLTGFAAYNRELKRWQKTHWYFGKENQPPQPRAEDYCSEATPIGSDGLEHIFQALKLEVAPLAEPK